MINSILNDFPYCHQSAKINGITIRYIDEGRIDAPVILFLHGVPTWSYTFRNIIPVCVSAGNRVIAPDIPGFGLSDKPRKSQNYTLYKLVGWLSEFLLNLKLQKLFIFGHDWGAILAMIIAANFPLQFSGIILCNGYLPVLNRKAPAIFHLWRLFARYSPFLPIGTIINLGCCRRLTNSEIKGYNFPFSTFADKIAVRVLPGLIPLNDNEPDAHLIKLAWAEMEKWNKPFLTIFSDRDPLSHGGHKVLQQRIPGTINQPCRIIPGKHFLQEDEPDLIGKIINDFIIVNS